MMEAENKNYFWFSFVFFAALRAMPFRFKIKSESRKVAKNAKKAESE